MGAQPLKDHYKSFYCLQPLTKENKAVIIYPLAIPLYHADKAHKYQSHVTDQQYINA